MSEYGTELREAFQATGRRLTSQRQLILEVLRESDEHLDAGALYDRVRDRDPSVSLATVYRTLSLLKALGLVEEHRFGEEHGHYEATGDEHYHFTCLSCGKVIEFDTPLVTQAERELTRREGVRVTGAHLHLSGYCAQCQTRAGGKSNNEE